MYIDHQRALQHRIAPIPFEVERGRVRFFASTIGLTDLVHFDVQAAQRAGHRDLLVPPTFLGHSLELEISDPMGWLRELGADLMKTTHAEQGFVYHAPAYAGDVLVLERKIVDVYTKKAGALEFVAKRTAFMRGSECIAESTSVIAIRHPEVAA
jgi:hypothetical protein